MSSLHVVHRGRFKGKYLLGPLAHLHVLPPNGFEEMCRGFTLNLSCEFNVIVCDKLYLRRSPNFSLNSQGLSKLRNVYMSYIIFLIDSHNFN